MQKGIRYTIPGKNPSYGDSDGLTNPQLKNLKGQLYVHNDEAGKLVYTDYDFKGNLLNHYRQLINDNGIVAYQKYVVNWDNFPSSDLSSTQNTITKEYDALNRVRKALYPKDRANRRKKLLPSYSKSGALQSLQLDSTIFVSDIAYNAKGQRILMAMGNGIMTRYAYDPENFRLLRTRSEKFTQSWHTYSPNGGVQQDLAYTYDLEGTITSINDEAPANNSTQGPGNLLRQFTHDPLRRLLTATGPESSNVYQQPSWDLNIRPEDYTATNTYSRTYQYDKLGNIQQLTHQANGHANQNFVRNYNYSDFTSNRLKDFSYGGNSYGSEYDACGNVIKEASNRYYQWSHNDKLATFSDQAGGGQPTVFANYFYNAAGERVQKQVRKGSRVEVTFYMDGGLFETTYVKPTGGSIDNNRFYNTLNVLDGTSRIATLRIGNDADDPTPVVKFYLEDQVMNSTVVLTATGNLINREEFYPLGETSFGGYGKKRYRYNGKEKDEESGLYNYGQRYYAPWYGSPKDQSVYKIHTFNIKSKNAEYRYTIRYSNIEQQQLLELQFKTAKERDYVFSKLKKYDFRDKQTFYDFHYSCIWTCFLHQQ